MTMKEKVRIHVQIEEENERKLKQWKNRKLIMEFYPLFCREGRLYEARLLLRFLRNGSITLGLDDDSARIEHLLEDLGFKAYYGRNYNTARYTI